MKKLLLIVFVLIQFLCNAGYNNRYVLSITQKYAIPENVVNGDYVGTWKKTYTWTPAGTISFSIEQNYNSAFSIDSSTGLITVSNASQINGQVSQQDMVINLIIRTTDANGGNEVHELDTARIWVKENAYCKFIDYGYSGTESGTRTQPYNDFSDVTVAAGYGYFIKRGNTPTDEIYSISGFQASAAHPTIIGAWGSGPNPEFNGSGLSSANGLFYFLNTSAPSTYCKIYNIDVKNYPGSAFRIATGSNRFGIYNCNFTTNVLVSYAGDLGDIYFYGSLDNILINYGHELINLESAGSMAPILKSDASGVYAYNIKSATAHEHNFRYAKSRYSKLSHFYFIGGTRSLQVRYPDIVITDGIISNAYNADDNMGAGIFLVTDTAGEPNDLIIRNVLFQNNQYAMYVYNSNINRTLIEDCKFESSTYNGIYYRYGGEASTIQRSAFINNGSHGILFRTGSQSSNLTINYCLFYGNTGNQIDASASSCATGLKLYNNTVDGNIDLTGASTEIVRNNFFKSLTSAATASNNLDIDTITTANHFQNYAGHDYRLKSTAYSSINQGYNVSLTSDFAGTSVPQGGTPDIGAYEYVPSATVSISATDASAAEEGQGTGTFTITRTTTSGNLTVNYSKTGTTSSGDYTQTLSGSVTISSGNTTATITITPVDDSTDEDDETVILTLTSGTGYTVGSPSSATVTIADNDYTTENVALSKTATQSSTLYSGVASRAVDGNTSGLWTNGSVTHTDTDTNSWWQVDLGGDYHIVSIQVWNRTDACCISRMDNFYVFLADAFTSYDLTTTINQSGVWSVHQTTYPNPSYTCYPDTEGRYVRVQLGDQNQLNIAEVIVMGYELEQKSASVNKKKENGNNLAIEPGTPLKVFPNPGKNKITVSGFTDASTLRIQDIQGKEVYQAENVCTGVEIDVRHFRKGMYLIIIEEGDKFRLLKFIKD